MNSFIDRLLPRYERMIFDEQTTRSSPIDALLRTRDPSHLQNASAGRDFRSAGCRCEPRLLLILDFSNHRS